MFVIENTDGVLTVNGHSYRDKARKTQNSNFALLSTIRFTQPFKKPIEYARYVASLRQPYKRRKCVGAKTGRFGDWTANATKASQTVHGRRLHWMLCQATLVCVCLSGSLTTS